MDGLGAAASATAVIQISGKVFDLCWTYYSEVNDGRKDIGRLRDEVKSLQDVLTNVAELADAPGSAKLSILRLNQPNGPIQQCRMELIELARKLETRQGKDKMRALKWPFRSKGVDNAIADIDTYQDT